MARAVGSREDSLSSTRLDTLRGGPAGRGSVSGLGPGETGSHGHRWQSQERASVVLLLGRGVCCGGEGLLVIWEEG